MDSVIRLVILSALRASSQAGGEKKDRFIGACRKRHILAVLVPESCLDPTYCATYSGQFDLVAQSYLCKSLL